LATSIKQCLKMKSHMDGYMEPAETFTSNILVHVIGHENLALECFQ